MFVEQKSLNYLACCHHDRMNSRMVRGQFWCDATNGASDCLMLMDKTLRVRYGQNRRMEADLIG